MARRPPPRASINPPRRGPAPRAGINPPPPRPASFPYHWPASAYPAPLPGPPAGSYDPALDAELRAAQRGYGDVQADTELATSRAAQDYGLGTDTIRRDTSRSLQDIATARANELAGYTQSTGNELADYTQSMANEQAGYDRNTALLSRQFQQLAGQEAQGARQAGVLSGGIALLSAAKHDSNQQVEQQGYDLSHGQAVAGMNLTHQQAVAAANLAHEQALAGYDTATSRTGENQDLALGDAGLTYNRGVSDRETALSRAGRENTAFGLDVGAQKAYQAAAQGWMPPKPAPTATPAMFKKSPLYQAWRNLGRRR
jgi:hypothetical protein